MGLFRVCDYQKALKAVSSIHVIIIIDNASRDHERGQYDNSSRDWRVETLSVEQ